MHRLVRKHAAIVSRKVLSRLNDSPLFRGAYYESLPENTRILADTAYAQFLVNTSDKVIGKMSYRNRVAYDFDRFRLACTLLPGTTKPKILIDVGANVGTVSISAVRSGLFDGALAIEPEPRNFKALKLNVMLNELEDVVEIHNVAAGSTHDKSLNFELSETNYGDHRVQVSEQLGKYSEQSRRKITVAAKTIDEILGPQDPTSMFVWIDTQGYEGAVLCGATNLINHRVPICFEFWPYGLQRTGGFNLLKSSLAAGDYRHLVDLNQPDEILTFSVTELDSIFDRVGSDGSFTDVLVY